MPCLKKDGTCRRSSLPSKDNKMFNELDIVKTNKEISPDIPKDTEGVIHQVYPNDPNSYLVEFMDSEDSIIDIVEVSENDIFRIWEYKPQ